MKKKNNINVLMRFSQTTKDLLDAEALKRGYTISRVAENHILNDINNESDFMKLIGFMNGDGSVDVSGMDALSILAAFDARFDEVDENGDVDEMIEVNPETIK
jgi:hypothetical protein